MDKRIAITGDMQQEKLYYRLFFLFFFVLASFAFIRPIVPYKKAQFHSSELKRTVVKDEFTETVNYVSESGEPTIAADLGYSTIVYNKVPNGKIEHYYGEDGEAISVPSGYYGVFREFDGDGNNISNTYLDLDDKPIMTLSGYAIMKCEFNEYDQLVAIRYYDEEENPVVTPSAGHGKIFEYDENGQICRAYFVDTFNSLMMIQDGYAIVTYHYYLKEDLNKGKVESEFYFDERENPISLSLEQYGVHKEYDEYGRISVLTYLDGNGKPIQTNKGYTTIAYTYHPNGSIATEKYYDIKGNPFPLSEGQYGFKMDNNSRVYLDQNGDETFNLRNVLYNHSWIIIPVVIASITLSSMLSKKWNALFLIMYLCAIGYMTLMFRKNSDIKAPGIFLSYGMIFTDSTARADILRNIWLFIPLGSILYWLYPKKIMLLIPIILSVLIEGIQYFFGLGFCELDDVISNGLGGWIGFIASKLTSDLKLCIKKRNHILSL